MAYSHGYPQGQHAGYQDYGQLPQTHVYQAHQGQYQQQHPVVIIPRQPRHEIANFQTSPLPTQPQYQQGYYQQAPQSQVQYQQPNQRQYFDSQRQNYPSQAGLTPQYPDQSFYQVPPALPVHQSTPNYSTSQQSAQLQYQQQRAPQVQYQQQRSPQAQYQQRSSPQVQHQQQPSRQIQYQEQSRFAGQSQSQQFPPQPLPLQDNDPSLTQSPQPYVNPQVLVNSSRPQPNVRTPKPPPRHQQQTQILSSPDPLQQATPPSQRVVARVEIPVQKSSSISTKSAMGPATKRRRSNEGQAIPVSHDPIKARRTVSNQHVQAPPSSSPLTQLTSSQMPPTPSPILKTEYQSMLLALSDEYINAAYSMSSYIESDEQRNEYHRLMSTGMACLEILLSNYRQSDARREARIRLRLANLMVDETDNDEDVVEILAKGKALCNQNRFVDLKYAMEHTSVRFAAKKKSKEALKAVDNLIQEVEMLRLSHWSYTFRFLRASLSLQSGIHAELTAALKCLNTVKALADEERNISVQIVAASIEAVIHLRIGSSEAGDLAQRAMAAARMHQLGPEMQALPQMRGLLDCLDLTWALVQLDHKQAAEKMQQMHANLDKGTRDAGWTKDGSFTIDLGPTDNEELDQDAKGIMKIKDGQAGLVVKWITGAQLYALGYLLSGVTTLFVSSGDSKVENFIGEGIKMTKAPPSHVRQSLSVCEANIEQSEALHIAMRLYAVFARCGQGDWQSARPAIQELRKDIASVGADLDVSTQRMLLYLEGMCKQGLGELKDAAQLYESPLLAIQLDTKASVSEKDIRALATINRILILRSLSAAENKLAENLLAQVESYCRDHPNEALLAACQILKATPPGSNGSIIKTKQYLQSAIQAAKRAQNKQLIYMLMNLMTASFFADTIIGDQAEKAAHAGRQLAKGARSRLWTVVADSMYSDIMERCGKLAEAGGARKEAVNLYPALPEDLKEKLSHG